MRLGCVYFSTLNCGGWHHRSGGPGAMRPGFVTRSVSDALGDVGEHLPFSSGSAPARAGFAQIYECASRAPITSGNCCMKLQSTLGTAGAGLCCPQPGQLLPTHLTSAPPRLGLSNQGARPHSQDSCHRAFITGARVRPHRGSPLPEPGDAGLLSGAGCAWLGSTRRHAWPLSCPGGCRTSVMRFGKDPVTQVYL